MIDTLELTDEQRSILDSIENDSPKFHIITGHAGTGKTLLLSRIISSAVDTGKRVQVLAPTAAALAVLEDRLPDSSRISYRTVAAVLQCTTDAISLGHTAPRFPLTSTGLKDFARFLEMLNVDHSGIITAWNTATDTGCIVDCTNPDISLSGSPKHIMVNTQQLAERLSTVFSGTSPFHPEVVTTPQYTSPSECAARMSNQWGTMPDLIVVDEYSMVNAEQADILHRAVEDTPATLIGCGDPMQLQPVTGQPNPFITDNADHHATNVAHHQLTTILRSEDSVLTLANDVRRGARFVDLAIAGDISRVDSTEPHELIKEHPQTFTEADVVLGFRNASVDTFNQLLRQLHGLHGAIQRGDQIVCNANVTVYDTYAFRNGELYSVVDAGSHVCHQDVETLRHRATVAPGGMIAVFVSLVDEGQIVPVAITNRRGQTFTAFTWAYPHHVDPQQHLALQRAIHPLFVEGDVASSLLDVSYAHALTVHKAQGSEWNNVVYVVSQRDLSIQGTAHAPYTAVTRAKKNVTVFYSR